MLQMHKSKMTTIHMIKSMPIYRNFQVLSLSFHKMPESHYLLGGIYETGEEGVPVDFERAVMWYQLADAGGNVDSKYRLGLCYYYGRGVAEDKQQGLACLQQAASQEHEGAKRAILDILRR